MMLIFPGEHNILHNEGIEFERGANMLLGYVCKLGHFSPNLYELQIAGKSGKLNHQSIIFQK
jgi:hypothetical protein